jgi:hypothetical protein
MGDFDRHPKTGKIQIKRDENEIKIDREGRKVNDKGYLIDD